MTTATESPRLDLARIDADALKAEAAAQNYVRLSVSFTWPGTSRSVKGALKSEIVDGLEAAAEAVSASTRMYNWRNPALAAARELKAEITAFVKRNTVAWPDEPGARLLPKTKLDRFERQMQGYVSALAEAAVEVQAVREEILEQARAQRGRAFSEADYPADLAGLFSLSWSYSTLVVSEELKAVSQTAYAAEKTRQTARLLGAIRTAEEMSVRELHALAGKLQARLEAIDRDLSDGEARLPLSASLVESLSDFCSRFASVMQWGCDDLAEVVAEAGGSIDGLTAADLKRDRETRGEVSVCLLATLGRLESIIPALAEEQYAGVATRAPAASESN